MLFAFLYLALLCVWFWATRHLRADGAGPSVTAAARRLRSWWGDGVAVLRRSLRALAPAASDTPAPPLPSPRWTCEISWQPGQLRFQAVMAPNDAPVTQPLAEATGLRWPKGVHKPSTRELESTFKALAASIAAAGWEPVQSRGPSLERRFVWRRDGEPPTGVELLGIAPTTARAAAELTERGAQQRAARTGHERAPRGANRDAVLRAVAARPGVTLRELADTSRVKRSSLPPLLRRLTLGGELERITRPDGRVGYALARKDAGSDEGTPEVVEAGQEPP